MSLNRKKYLFFNAEIFDLLERVEMILEQHFSVRNGVLRADEDERHRTLFPRYRRGRFVIALDLDSDDAALVDDLLDEATVLTNHLPHKGTRDLK